MQHLDAFKKHVSNYLKLLIHGLLVDKPKLFVNVNQLTICNMHSINKEQIFIFISYSREQLRAQAKRKGLTTCLIRDAGMKK